MCGVCVCVCIAQIGSSIILLENCIFIGKLDQLPYIRLYKAGGVVLLEGILKCSLIMHNTSVTFGQGRIEFSSHTK